MIQVEFLECESAKKSISDPQPASISCGRRWIDKSQIIMISEHELSSRNVSEELLKLITDFWEANGYNKRFYVFGMKFGSSLSNICLTEEQLQQLTS